jgi:serine/threonine protein kinase/Tfp pilus assembly protein PilF
MPFVIGENIGPYRLLEQLGQGGMATVFKAYHPALDRYVAIKALHPALTNEPNFLARFQREAQVVARLEHPNIVPVYDYSEYEGRPYLVMKYIEGETLKARLKRGPLDRTELGAVVDSVGAALSYAHQQGVLHRDVKPSNVLLATDGRIYLADFGLARMAEAGESTISSDVMLGTPQYISPEQASGRHDLDNGTDIYSFGILLYELLVGKVPYIADTPYSIIHDHIYAPLPLPRSSNPEIPEAVERVLLRALAKDRLDRFVDIAALLEAWRQAFQEPAEVPALPPAPIEASVASVAERIRAAETRISELPAASNSSGPIPPEAAANLLPGELAQGVHGGERSGKRPPVWMVVGIIFVLVCLCVGASILYSRARKKARQASVTELSLVVTVGLTPTPQSVDTSYPLPYVYPLVSEVPVLLPTLRQPRPVWNALQATGTVSQTGQIEAALAAVQQDPQSAAAYLDLAIAYGVHGMPDEAQQAFKTAVGLAAVPADFYQLAGDRIAEREAWGLAAAMYLEALTRVPDPAPSALLDKINQSLYLAATAPEIQALLAKAPADRLSPGIIDAVRARGAIYRGEAALARAAIRRFKTQYPDNPIVQLLNAELLHQSGDVTQAQGILTSLIGAPNTPPWVPRVAEYLLNQAKN